MKPDFSPFNDLQSSLTDFSTEGTIKNLELLKQCSSIKISRGKLIRQYHDNLLFILSYAESEVIYSAAKAEMDRLVKTVKEDFKLQEQLIGSGIAGTVTQGAYSLTLISWLIKKFPGTISAHSFDEDGIHPKEILKHILPEAEFELLSDEKLSRIKWLEKASGTKNKKAILKWLIDCFNAMKASSLLKDQLFESMKLFIEIEPFENSFSRSFGEVKISKRYFHSEGLLKKFSEAELINKKLPPEKKLSPAEKAEIIDQSRVALCLLNRETDPVTYCEELNIKYFELERGLSIALFSIDSERRLPIESYIGFMMFKNGYPMSYGGAWLFGKRSLIGINIFEAFRGGESAIVFAQLLRCYKMAFGATYFEVEPYQFGKNNPEGIQSGAFWFYYRFGFKPCDKKLYERALNEHQKIITTKGYRTSADILRQFTGSNLFVFFDKDNTVPLNPSDLSKFVTFKISKEYKGDRELTLRTCLRELKKEKILTGKEKGVGINKLIFFVALCLDLKKLNSKEKGLLQKLFIAKGSSEFDYINLCRQFSFETNVNDEFKKFAEASK